MSDFLAKSKDQYFANQSAFAHFLPVFETIDRMSKVKTYFTTDLLNIEDILSILEMQYHLVGTAPGEAAIFKRYIEDVISATTHRQPRHQRLGHGVTNCSGRSPERRTVRLFQL